MPLWTLLLGAGLCGYGSGGEPPKPAPPGPGAAAATAPAGFVIPPYLQNPGRTEMTITWICASAQKCVLRYGQGAEPDRELAVEPLAEPIAAARSAFLGLADAAAGEKHYQYAARLAGLAAGTAYRYTVTCAGGRVAGGFRTVPERAAEFSFIAYGDSRSGIEAHRRVAARFPAHDPAFVVHTGDMTGSGAYYQWMPQFFGPLGALAGRVPVLVARGNHDGDDYIYRRLFGEKTWYSFDYGDAHLVCLDSNVGEARSGAGARAAMLKWCREDLAASRAPWKIAFYHHPSYDSGGYRSAWGRKDFLPVFRKAGVDLVLTGHDHTYQRFKPMFTRGENQGHPITHIVTAGGGAGLYELARHPYMAAGNASEHHYLVLTVSGDKLSGRAISSGGQELDAFVISRKDGRPDDKYLAQAVPEEKFDELQPREPAP